MRHTHRLQTKRRDEIIDLTSVVRSFVRDSKIDSGLLVVFCPHTTAGLSVNENYDPDVKRDVLNKLDAMIPHDETYYRHGEGNSAAHVKTILTGPSLTLIVERGDVLLGRWQGVYFCEFDGPRERQIELKLLAGG